MKRFQRKLGFPASGGAGRSPRATARISRSSESRLRILNRAMSWLPFVIDADNQVGFAPVVQITQPMWRFFSAWAIRDEADGPPYAAPIRPGEHARAQATDCCRIRPSRREQGFKPNGVAHDGLRNEVKPGNTIDRAFGADGVRKRHGRNPGFGRDGLPESARGVDDDRCFPVEGTPARHRIIGNIEVLEAALDDLLYRVLAPLQIEQLGIAGFGGALEKNGSPIRAKSSGRERARVVDALARIIEAVSDGLQAESGVDECLDEAKLDEVAKTQFKMIGIGVMRTGPMEWRTTRSLPMGLPKARPGG